MRKLIFTFCFLFLRVSFVFAFQIGNISFDLNDVKLTVSNPKGQILSPTFDDSTLSYEYILETPYFELSGYDGVVEKESSKGLKNLLEKDLTAESFTKFAFFSHENNTIGLLLGSARASGSSCQDVYFINTQTGSFIKLQLIDMQEMTWITENGRSIGYKEYDTNFSFGTHAVSWGYKARITAIAYFDGDDGNITFNKDELKNIYKSEYDIIGFSDEEKTLLQDNIMSDMEYRPLGEKLVDFVYYGFKIGKQQEVFEFLNTLDSVYAQEAKIIMGNIIK